MQANHELLLKLAHYKMPFGKHQGRYLSDLPDAYLLWLLNNKVGGASFLAIVTQIHDIQLNGLRDLLLELRKRFPEARKP